MPSPSELLYAIGCAFVGLLLGANIWFIKRLISNLDKNTSITEALQIEVAVIKTFLGIKCPSAKMSPSEGKS